MLTRRQLGKNILGSIFAFLDILDYEFLRADYPETIVIWRRHTYYEKTITEHNAIYRVNGKYHRLDGPAVKDACGDEFWYQNDLLHRLDGPASIEGGTKSWLQKGFWHRLDGPAVEHASGMKEWCKDGKLHRIGGPAIEFSDGAGRWYQNNKLHRTDGPAIEDNGTKEWWINGKRVDPF